MINNHLIIPPQSVIYQIKNIITNKIYIGSAVNYKFRCNNHKSNLNLNKHKNKYLQSSWNKYGENNFEFFILEYVENKNDLIKREQYWIDKTKCCDRKIGYNVAISAGSNLGRKFNWTKEHIEKIRNSNKGKKRSQETINNISLSQIGKKLSEEHKKKLSKVRIGYKFSEESKNKIGSANSNSYKWPCKDKSYCKCASCNEKRNNARRKNKVFPAFILITDYVNV